MKGLFIKLNVVVLLLLVVYSCAYAQSASTSVAFSGFQACGGCTVCGADYWCTNTPGSYCGNTQRCRTRNFADPIPPGNVVTGLTIKFFTASCVGSSIETSINGFNVPIAFDGSSGCLCSNLPCVVTTSVTSNFPCGMPGYIYGGNNAFQVCSNGPMCINRADITFTYVREEQITPIITPSGPLTFCSGESVTLNANTGFSVYNWNTGESTQSITVNSSGTYTVTCKSISGCTTGSDSVKVNVISVTPTFINFGPYCEGDTPDILPTTSNNGITGTWIPSIISTQSQGVSTYYFTPDTNQCAIPLNVDIKVNQSLIPIFDSIPPFCEGTTAPVLPNTSINGVSGTWNPGNISNTSSGTYIFTPTSNICTQSKSITTTVIPKSVTSLIYHD